jgi:hypothetical protein
MSVVVTGLFEKGFNPPKTIDLSGSSIDLVEEAFALGIEGEKVMFQGKTSGTQNLLSVAEASFTFVKDRSKSCECGRLVLKGKKCWNC